MAGVPSGDSQVWGKQEQHRGQVEGLHLPHNAMTTGNLSPQRLERVARLTQSQKTVKH